MFLYLLNSFTKLSIKASKFIVLSLNIVSEKDFLQLAITVSYSYLLGYKLVEKEGIPCCGFPINAISKVENILEKRKVNYIVVDRRNNYEEEEKYINNQENNYDKIFEKSKQTIDKLLKIQKINQYLIQHKEDEKIEEILERMEKIIND